MSTVPDLLNKFGVLTVNGVAGCGGPFLCLAHHVVDVSATQYAPLGMSVLLKIHRFGCKYYLKYIIMYISAT